LKEKYPKFVDTIAKSEIRKKDRVISEAEKGLKEAMAACAEDDGGPQIEGVKKIAFRSSLNFNII
jgi:hypothetical protein